MVVRKFSKISNQQITGGPTKYLVTCSQEEHSPSELEALKAQANGYMVKLSNVTVALTTMKKVITIRITSLVQAEVVPGSFKHYDYE